MTIELVDGHAGKPHISGDDLGDFKAGILGDGGYVFKRANMLAATLNGANSITIDTGSGVLPVSGRHFRITAPETATITSGTQGQNRNDLIIIRPTTSSDGTTTESVSVLVLRGTPTTDAASDPVVEETDLILYRVQLSGVSVSEPIALFDVMTPYNEFRDSISPSVLLDNPNPIMGKDYTLADSAANYSRMRIYYVDNDGYYGSVDMLDPNGKDVCLSTSTCSSQTGFWIKSRIVSISGTSVSTRKPSSWAYVGQTNVISPSVSHTDCIAITRIEAW